MTPPESPKLPDTDKLEALVSGVKLALGLVPFPGGSSLAEVVGYFGQRYISAKQRAFLEDVVARLEDLANRVEDLPERLESDQTFYSVLFRAIDAAQRTANQQKINALRNAVLNAALPDAPDESLQHTFVRYVDELTVWHLSLLDCIADPLAWAQRHSHPVYVTRNPDAASIFEGATRGKLPSPELNGVMLQDLLTRGLCTTGVNPYGALYPRGEDDVRPRITDLGRQFLAFVASLDDGLEDTDPLNSLTYFAPK